ncbi:alpha/beta fold hydrolase [Asticcacaulis taihuensis]|uniref:Pimeloyl-ACP methyl ester carboxylesterase n=1 Tax=Asticcacaulis taihuensis TaxID=260084 RepID=A0A1G4RUH4_9CAUL|nr:alpha/beta hydrolase [Asticcacaulis taihuensis]SCW60534.1 Pimeloyl-ACP methyl ester carboxylesterase [Asticcacaulis taihuensis]
MSEFNCPDRRRSGIFNRPMALIAIIVGIIAALTANHSRAATPFPDAASARFSVTVSGQGPDIILIPGLASSGAVWDDTVMHLKGHYRLHVLNLAGFAGEPAGANTDGEILAPSVEAIDAYIKASHLQKPVVVGHSLGGLMALMLAKAHPEDTGKLVIVDTLPYVGVIFSPTATVDMVRPQAAAMRDGMVAAPADAFRAQQAAGTARLVTDPDNQAKLLDWSMTSDRRVLAESFYEDMTIDLRPDLAAINTPTVLIYPVAAGEDATTTEATYQANYATKPNMTFHRIDNSRHFIMLDQPAVFQSALESALK